MSAVESKEIAFYYPGPMWHRDDWIKTMILFIDGIGISLPDERENEMCLRRNHAPKSSSRNTSRAKAPRGNTKRCRVVKSPII